jgi:hypothetical protein
MMGPHDDDHPRMSSRGSTGLRNAKACRRRIPALLTVMAGPVAFHFVHKGAPSKLRLGGALRRLSASATSPPFTSNDTTLGWATRRDSAALGSDLEGGHVSEAALFHQQPIVRVDTVYKVVVEYLNGIWRSRVGTGAVEISE